MRNTFFLAAIAFTTALQGADPALLNLVMPDVTVLMGINVQKAKTSAFGQFVLTQIPEGAGLDKFIAETGFDPRNDVSEVLIATSGGSKKAGLVMARGSFNAAQIESAISADGKHVSQTYNGAQLITATSANDQGAVAFLSSGIAIAGDAVNVKAAVDRSTGNNPLDAAIATKVAGFAAADAWSLTTVPLTSLGGATGGNGAGNSGNANPIAGALKSIQQSSGSITFSSPVQIDAEAVAQSDQDATSLADVIKFVASMMQGNQDAAPFAAILQGLNISTDHSIIKISVSIPEDQIEQLIKGAAQQKSAKKPVAVHV